MNSKLQITFSFIVLVVFIAIVSIVLTRNAEMEEPMSDVLTPIDIPEGQEVATFASGCFWCLEATMQQTEGVQQAISGYAGGTEENPTYEEVYMNKTGHREAVQVFFDPKVITYDQILDLFWQGIDPTDDGGQFTDRGFSYTTAIFYHNKSQRTAAEASKQRLDDSGKFDKPIVTDVLPFTSFYKAEEYHQDFFKKSPARYEQYSQLSGRNDFKAFVWSEIQKEQAGQ